MILQNACFYCDLRMVKLLFSVELLAKKTEEISVQSSLLLHACANENKEIIDFLKEKGFEINENDDENIIESKFRSKHEYKKNPLLDKNELALILIFIKRLKSLEARQSTDYTKIYPKEIEKYLVNLDYYELSFTNIYKNTDHGPYFCATRKNDKEKINKNNCLIALSNHFVICIRNNNKDGGKSDKEKITVQLVKYDLFTQTLIELKILQKMNHPVIVKFIGISQVPLFNWKVFKQIILSFTEYYVPNCTLKSHMINERNGMADQKFDLTKKYIILLGISHLMKCLHKNGIIYENLNPEFIILDENLYPKISDFKLANISNQPLKHSNLFRNEMRYKNTKIPYFAPELLFNRKFGSGIDVYAFGMIAYELISLKVPFEKKNLQCV